jgi:hypothetical protein
MKWPEKIHPAWILVLCLVTVAAATVVGVDRGGTGATTAAGARTNLAVPNVSYCGTSTTCSNTQQSSPRIIWGVATLSGGGTAVIGSISPAFTSTSSFGCTCSDSTASVNACNVQNTSTSSITVNGHTSDSVTYTCVGN